MSQSPMNCRMTRRSLLAQSGLAALGAGLLPRPARAAQAPAAPVALGRCASYGPELLPALQTVFDQLGGVGKLVQGKTVAIKVNLTGNPDERLGYLPIGRTTWTNPDLIAATVHLLGRAGARRIRLLESPWRSAEPVQEYISAAGWDPALFLGAAANVEFENTNFLGYGKKYVRFPVPHGGHLFPAFDLNHSYADCDVFVSIGKMKEHLTAGITLSMKNCFGITPCTIYGDGAPDDEAGRVPLGGRMPIHSGNRQPAKCSPRRTTRRARAKAGTACPAAWQTWWPHGPSISPSSTAWNRRPARKPSSPSAVTSRRTCWWPEPTPFAWMRWAPPSWVSTPWPTAAPRPLKPATAPCGWPKNWAWARAI